MLFHASIFLLTIFFFGLFESTLLLPVRFSLLIFLFLGAVFWLSWRFGGSIRSTIIPTLFSFSAFILLFFISSNHQKHVFIFLSALIFYLAILGEYRLRQYKGDLTAHGILSAISMVTLFFFFSAFYGLFLNFQKFDEIALMFSYGIGSFFVGLSFFSRSIPKEPERSRLLSLILGIFMAEIAWVSSFWPFGYLTTGVISLIVISVPWDMIRGFSGKNFSEKRLFFHTILALMLIGMVLSSSIWLPLV